MVTLSRYLLISKDKGFHYFQFLKKNEKFQWTKECEKALQYLKEYLGQTPILSKPIGGQLL